MAEQDWDVRSQVQGGSWGHSAGNFWDNDYTALKQIVDAMRPDTVDHAGQVFKDVSERMRQTLLLINRQAAVLGEHWGGRAAQQAMQKIQDLYDGGHEVYDKGFQTGNALQQHAKMQRYYQQSVTEENWFGTDIGVAGTSFGDWLEGDSHIGREIMQRLQNDTIRSNDNFPPTVGEHQVRTNMEKYNPNTDHPGGSGTGGVPGSGARGGVRTPNTDPFDAGSGASVPHPDTDGFGDQAGSGSGVGTGVDPSGGAGTDLASLGDGPGPGGLGVGGGGAGLGAGPGLGGGAGIGAGGVGFGGPNAPGFGGGMKRGAVGASGLGSGAGGGKGVTGRSGMGGGPMGAGHGTGEGEEERERSTWLPEDEDVWGANDDTAPPVIG